MRVWCVRLRHEPGGGASPLVSYAAYIEPAALPPDVAPLCHPRRVPGAGMALLALPFYAWAPAALLRPAGRVPPGYDHVASAALVASLRWQAHVLRRAFPEAPPFGAELFVAANLPSAAAWIDEPEDLAVARMSARRRWGERLADFAAAAESVSEADLFA